MRKPRSISSGSRNTSTTNTTPTGTAAAPAPNNTSTTTTSSLKKGVVEHTNTITTTNPNVSSSTAPQSKDIRQDEVPAPRHQTDSSRTNNNTTTNNSTVVSSVAKKIQDLEQQAAAAAPATTSTSAASSKATRLAQARREKHRQVMSAMQQQQQQQPTTTTTTPLTMIGGISGGNSNTSTTTTAATATATTANSTAATTATSGSTNDDMSLASLESEATVPQTGNSTRPRTVTTTANSSSNKQKQKGKQHLLRRTRVPGGGAAKVFGKASNDENGDLFLEDKYITLGMMDETTPTSSTNGKKKKGMMPPRQTTLPKQQQQQQQQLSQQDELQRIRDHAQAEFTVGPIANRRYHPDAPHPSPLVPPEEETTIEGEEDDESEETDDDASDEEDSGDEAEEDDVFDEGHDVKQVSSSTVEIGTTIPDDAGVPENNSMKHRIDFHESATAAVLSLLSVYPPSKTMSQDGETMMVLPGSPVSSRLSHDEPPPHTVLSAPSASSDEEPLPPSVTEADLQKHASVLMGDSSTAAAAGKNATDGGTTTADTPNPTTSTSDAVAAVVAKTGVQTYYAKSALGLGPLEQPLLTKKAEERIELVASQMRRPNKTLKDLIAAIAPPNDGVFSRGYMVRRKNACGALQVLTANAVHRMKICWTLGVLPCLTSVLEDSGNRDLKQVLPDLATRREFAEARKRAVSALMNLCLPQENRLAVFHSPRLIANVLRVINLDEGDARRGCCAILANLAKTKENRLLMAQVPGLLDAVAAVIDPAIEHGEDDDCKSVMPTRPKKKKGDKGRSPKKSAGLEPVKEGRQPRGRDDDEGYSSGASDYDDDDSEGDLPLYSMDTTEASVGAPHGIGPAESYNSEDSAAMMLQQKQSVNVMPADSRDHKMIANLYDSHPNPALHGARQNIFALISHLVKEKDNAYVLPHHKYLVETLVAISKLHLSDCHEHAVKLLAHFTRHRSNSKHLVFKVRSVLPALVKALQSPSDEARKYACFALQNLSQDKPCRQELAITPVLLSSLCLRARQATIAEERLAAIHALKNLTDEPANLIPMTNTPECFATLMQIAHASDESVTEMMQYLGCDALATLSHWFRSIATSGQRIDFTKRGQKPPTDLFVPSLKIVGYEQWQ